MEFPAQGYVNPINTTFEFDVTLATYGTPGSSIVRFQNNIQCIFNRVRILYGATPLEDIIQYNVIVRALTEWTSTNQVGSLDQTSIAEGIGGVVIGTGGTGLGGAISSYVNVRQAYIHGVDSTTTVGFSNIPNSTTVNGITGPTRRYQVNLALGLLTQDKLLPVKFMASQLSIELSLAPEAECILAQATGSGNNPTYGVSNFNMIPEILEFDSSYDAMFLKGLQDGGVPIKFSSWHSFIFSTGGSSSINVLVQERSRSVKALFAVQRRAPSSLLVDHGAFLFSSTPAQTLQNYQYRIGGRYFPAQPVQCSTTVGSAVPNGGCEAYVELQKALNIVGDYRLSTSTNVLRWGMLPETITLGSAALEGDFTSNQKVMTSAGVPSYLTATAPYAGNVGSACYASAIDLETSNGIEISGLNAEEQSDISFSANFSGAQQANYNIEIYSYYDAMIILRENNVLELIQ